MTIVVQMFAAAKDRTGTSVKSIQLNDNATVGMLRRELAPILGDLLPRCSIAVNHEFASEDAELRAGDEVAVIPPVSGG